LRESPSADIAFALFMYLDMSDYNTIVSHIFQTKINFSNYPIWFPL